ncbi:hypothetical protein [Mesorhizobium abyssinicae]|uniref:hypothetical protein n=1 Tax=Mesorhizobium abyssinicae TaxID=1209958 RepID=UPI001092C8EA|nr:hypothetical protein EN873_14445 [bacterium M00.F.Ca.ET.230.01.1.1]
MYTDNQYVFTSPADAVETAGFLIVCNKAVSFVAGHYACSAKLNLEQVERARRQWADLAAPLPLERYRPEKRELLAIATLIEALVDIPFVHYASAADDATSLLFEFPAKVTALVMGIIIYDITLRTRMNRTTEIRYIDLERITGAEMQKAIKALHERRSRKYKFRLLLSILRKFSTPIVFH